jgi:hypothetical protein
MNSIAIPAKQTAELPDWAKAPRAWQVRFLMWLLRCNRAHDETVGEESGGRPDYLIRWHIIPHARTRGHWAFFKSGNAYLHNFNRSDDDRALHDHPWGNFSLLLSGCYWEHMPGGVRKLRRPGQMVFRSADTAHRIELLRDSSGKEIPVWTIFITGPKVREWYFLCPQGMRHNTLFTNPLRPGETGRGCAD